MHILFIGGTGNISSACVDLALDRGYQVTVLNRGTRISRLDKRVSTIIGDRDDPQVLQRIAGENRFDVVANFVGFIPDQIENDIAAFGGRIGQYIYISSASAYQKPLNHYVITESTPLYNPYWAYAREKIACEERLVRAYREEDFPITIVRPSYTYGPTWIPSGVGGHGYTVVHRMRQELPIISHGDGQSLWVMTHNSDFAVGFVGLFGVQQAIGEAFHITSDEVLTWDEIYRTIGRAAGAEPDIIHIPSDFIAHYYPDLGAGLLGDKAHSVVFDNSKIKRIVPEFRATTTFAQGIAQSIAWHDADPSRQVVNKETNAIMDR
ncbi:MAG TPA: SDR family oxidoreductase, partial [Chloroflexi bacterium]|nr:SDR family oxidoreductase [Chloroflexota bacterium]